MDNNSVDNKTNEKKMIHFRTDTSTMNKIKELAVSNGSNSITNTIQTIFDNYFTYLGTFRNPADNVFLKEFKRQVSESLNELISNESNYSKTIIASINELNKNVIALTVSNKEKNIGLNLLMEDIRELIGGDSV